MGLFMSFHFIRFPHYLLQSRHVGTQFDTIWKISKASMLSEPMKTCSETVGLPSILTEIVFYS